MKILSDHCVPRPLRRYFGGHRVEITAQNGWEELSNGKLLNAAESRNFEVFVTVDQNLQHQQNLVGRKMYILILVTRDTLTSTLAPLVPEALEALESMQPGELRQIVAPGHPAGFEASAE